MNIKPIETFYNGYRFRSRLEARWAIFFDELGIKYQYELEGFELSNNIRYLPDFYIEQMNLFVEIKPSLNSISENDIDKMDSFVFIGNKNLLLIVGEPTKEQMFLINDRMSVPLNMCKAEYNKKEENLHQYWKEKLVEESSVNFDLNSITGDWILISNGMLHQWFIEPKIRMALLKAIRSRFEFKERRI